MKPRSAVLAAALVIALNIAGLRAQTPTAQVSGTVLDPTGAAVLGAIVSVTNVENGIQRNAISNVHGNYLVPLLPPGRYRIVAQCEGFRPTVRSDVSLAVNQLTTVDFVLSLVQLRQAVGVDNGAELLQQSSAELGTVVARHAVHNLPLNGRNFTQLLTLTPGATPVSTAQASTIGPGDGATAGIPGSGFVRPSLHGQFNRSVMYFIDGIINTDFRVNTYAHLPSVDLVEEFKVQSHNDKAEFGGVTGGLVNIVSRSGGNTLHGSAFEFVRNEAFDARNPFKDATQDSPAPFRQNQFGATLGGPIIRNRAFFYGGYDGWRYRRPTQTYQRVPTMQELSGDFSNSIIDRDIYDPYTTRKTTTGVYIRNPFPGRRIPDSLISPMMQRFMTSYGDRPNLTDPTYNFVLDRALHNDSDNWQVKLDHHYRDRAGLFFRWSEMLLQWDNPQGDQRTGVSRMHARNFGGGLLQVLRPGLILDMRGGYTERRFDDYTEHAAGLDLLHSLGFTDAARFGGFQIGLISPWEGTIGVAGPTVRSNPAWNAGVDLVWLSGNHNVKAGVQRINVERLQINDSQTYYFDDIVTGHPGLPATTGASLASAILGLPARFVGWAPQESKVNFSLANWSAYVQDEWKATPGLTITAGVRFDYSTRPRLNQRSLMAGQDLDHGLYLIGASAMPPPCADAGIAPCIPGSGLTDVPHAGAIRLAGDAVFLPESVWDNWGPRVSLAWRARPTVAVRAGYGLSWDTLPGRSQYVQHNLEARWPSALGFSGTANRLGQPPELVRELQSRYRGALPEPTPWSFQGWTNDPDRKDAYSHQWNIEIQKQVAASLLLAIAYVGSANGRLEYAGLGNTALKSGPGTPEEVNARRPVPFMGGGIMYSRSIGRSTYNALQVKADRRFSSGFQTLVSYTWSKSIDTGSSGWFGAEDGPGGTSAVQNYHDPDSNRSVSSYNVPHFLSWHLLYEVPLGRGRHRLNHGPMSWVLGGWQVNSILQARSGQPFNLSVAGDVANIGNDYVGRRYARPHLTGDPRVGNATAERYFDTAAFAIPKLEYGNFGRNVLSTERVFDVDLSLVKTLAAGQDHQRRLELRFEAFNLLNVMNWGAPATTIGLPDAGRITSLAVPPRDLQFGLRLQF